MKKDIRINLNQFLYSISLALDAVEAELVGVTKNHSKRVAYLSILVGNKMGFSQNELIDLAAYSALHDNALTEYITREYQKGNTVLMKENPENIEYHCTVGEKNISVFPFCMDEKNVIKYHHENVNGTGLFGIKGDDIPIMAKIIRITDRIDVIFKLSINKEDNLEKIKEYIIKTKGILYDTKVANVLIDVLDGDVLENLSNENIEENIRKVTPEYEINISYDKMIEISKLFAHIIDYKSSFTLKHSTGIAKKAKQMAIYYKFDYDILNQFYIAAFLHDIGKLVVPTKILEKPAKLTDEEFEIVQSHAYYSHKILSVIDGFSNIEKWGSSHHERLDGKGYFRGIGAKELDFPSRLLACIDIYQALVEERPYRKGMDHKRAMQILREMSKQGAIDENIVEDIDEVLKKEE